MAILGTLQVPQSTGGASACCPCADQSGCNCTGGCTLVCQSRTSASGLATFCGFAEFTSPSVPPIYYRTMTLSGGWAASGYPNNGCTISPCGATALYSGSAQYDKDTCAFSDSRFLTVTTGCGATYPSTGSVTGLNGSITVNSCGIGASTVATQQTETLSQTLNICISSGSGYENAKMTAQTSLAALSDVDLPADAIARAVAGRAWGGTDCAVNFSSTGVQAAGSRTFPFTAAQVQVIISGNPGGSYQVSVQLSQQAVGSGGPLVPIGLLVFELTLPPDSPTGISEFQQIPNVQGYEVHATGCTVMAV